MSKSTLGLSAAACTSVALLCAAPAVAGPKSPQTPSELGAEFQSQGYKVQYERIGNCALDSGSVVGTRIGPAVWADTTTQTKAGGGVGDGAGTRGVSRGPMTSITRSPTSRWHASARRNELRARSLVSSACLNSLRAWPCRAKFVLVEFTATRGRQHSVKRRA